MSKKEIEFIKVGYYVSIFGIIAAIINLIINGVNYTGGIMLLSLITIAIVNSQNYQKAKKQEKESKEVKETISE